MNFTKFQQSIYNHVNEMQNKSNTLFQVFVDKDDMWQHYLQSFPDGSNPIYRERTEHDCSCCRHFIKNMGNVVAIIEDKIVTIWDVDIENEPEYTIVANSMADYIRSKPIENVWMTYDKSIGTKCNYEIVDTSSGNLITWEHFYADIDRKFILNKRESIGEKLSYFRSSFDVFRRSLTELTLDSTETVLELIADGSLYRGEEWKQRLSKFHEHQIKFSKIAESDKDIYCWSNLSDAFDVARIRNTSIGTLLIDISNDVELDVAVRKYENVVAPTNYKRPKAIFTKRMLEDAKKTVTELGYMDSLPRRFATIDDITVNNILFCNKDVSKKIKSDNIFDVMASETAINPKNFNRVKEINIKDFIQDVLPTTVNLEILFENRLKSNMMSLIAPVNEDAPSMFKWDNPFSWSYAGDITDSDIKQNVKTAGGKVEGDLRFSIQWNDKDEYDGNDLDAHCKTPTTEIYFNHKCDYRSKGSLDVDIVNPEANTPAVENIIFPNRMNMPSGKYVFFVHNFSNRGGRTGFRAEIEFDGVIYSYDYNKPLKHGENVYVATVTLDKSGNFSIIENINSDSSINGQTVWNISTNHFIPVSVMMYSPNYWDEQTGIGNRHYFFMLKDCINTEKPRGFFNEYLKSALDKHKRIFEALGNRMAVEDSENQLSGVGFSSTRSNHVIVKVQGKSGTERILKVVI